MADPSTEDLVLLYLAGKLDGAQAERIKAFLETSERQRGALAGLRTALQYEELRAGAPAIQTSLRAFRERLRRAEVGRSAVQVEWGSAEGLRSAASGTAKEFRDHRLSVWSLRTLRRGVAGVGNRTVRYAGWVTGIAFTAILVILLGRHSKHDLGMTRTYVTAVGQRATLFLDDGTRVTMAPQTTLRLVGFGESKRTVVLNGEAYFEVAQFAAAPFVVSTSSATTTVLGTKFSVRHYADDAATRIAVATGKVLVMRRLGHLGITLTTGHVADVTDSTQVVKAVDSMDSEISWVGDQLVFQDAPMSEVLKTLKRWYGYEFRFADSTFAQQTITVGLSPHSSAEALSTLKQILNVRLTIVGDTVTMTPLHAPAEARQHRYKDYDVWTPSREVGR